MITTPAPYTFGNLKNEVRFAIWPNDGGPENLRTAINRYILQAVNWMQQNIECLKDEHLDVTPQCDTYFHCGLSVIDRPDGVVSRLFTVQRAGFCDPVTYDECNPTDILSWSRWLMKIVTSPVNAGLKSLPGGFTQSASSTDDTYGRALTGRWAKDKGRILISPWLQSYESVVLEWSGFKSTWNDSDLVPSSPDYIRAVKLFVQREYARDFERDPGFQQVCGDDLQGNIGRNIVGALPSLIFQCNEKMRQRKNSHSVKETDYLWYNYEKPETSEVDIQEGVVVACIGDYGVNSTAEGTIATMVKSWNPVSIITSGNNNYTAGLSSTIDVNVGKYYSDYISPYNGDYGPDLGGNRFFPTLGNRDLDTTIGTPYLEYFTPPLIAPGARGRYYTKIIGPIHFFFIDSGYNTSGVLVEPDGNEEDSVQANWIINAAIRSTIKWKVAVFNSPPYSSVAYSVKTAMRWDFARYGFDAVINAGDTHAYERFEVSSFPYLVNGSGGSTLVAFTTTATGSVKQYSADNGALKITATTEALTFDFINSAEVVIDTLTLT